MAGSLWIRKLFSKLHITGLGFDTSEKKQILSLDEFEQSLPLIWHYDHGMLFCVYKVDNRNSNLTAVMFNFTQCQFHFDMYAHNFK